MSSVFPLSESEWREYLEKHLESKVEEDNPTHGEDVTCDLFERALLDGPMPTVHAYYLT